MAMTLNVRSIKWDNSTALSYSAIGIMIHLIVCNFPSCVVLRYTSGRRFKRRGVKKKLIRNTNSEALTSEKRGEEKTTKIMLSNVTEQKILMSFHEV